jgi:hypothetical protein
MFFFSSCKKEEEKSVVSGKVINSVTGSALSSGTVFLYGQEMSSGSWNSSYTLLGQSAISGGAFNIEIEQENITSYRLDIVNDLFFKIENFYTSDNFSDNTLNKTFYIDPSANVTIIVNNTSQYDINDYFKYTISNGFADYPDCCSQIEEFNGLNVSDTIICKVIGEQEVKFTTRSIIDNTTNNGEVIKYCTPGENTEILINY